MIIRTFYEVALSKFKAFPKPQTLTGGEETYLLH